MDKTDTYSSKSRLQSRSVYFIKDEPDNYDGHDYQSSRFKNIYDSRSNLSSKRSHSNSTDNLGFKPIGSLISTKSSTHSNTPSSGRDAPVVNMVTNNNDIVYVPRSFLSSWSKALKEVLSIVQSSTDVLFFKSFTK